MNSQIFPDNTMIQSNQTESAGLLHWRSPAVQWISIIILIAFVILFPERPAWGDDVLIEVDAATAKGVACEAKLGEAPAERAIQIILLPLGHALVHPGTSEALKIRIDQIQVYYAHPAMPVSEPTTAPTTDKAFEKSPADETKIPALAIAYGTE